MTKKSVLNKINFLIIINKINNGGNNQNLMLFIQ